MRRRKFMFILFKFPYGGLWNCKPTTPMKQIKRFLEKDLFHLKRFQKYQTTEKYHTAHKCVVNCIDIWEVRSGSVKLVTWM